MNRMRMLCAVMGVALLWGCSGAGGPAAGKVQRYALAGESAKPAAPPVAEDRRAASEPAAGADQPSATGSFAGIPAGSLSGLPGLPSQRMVIKTAELAVRVNDVSGAFARAVQLAETGGGYVQSSTQSQEGGDRADLTIRIPPNGFLPLLASLGALGTVTSKTISGEDVTQEYYDLGAELDNQQEVRGRLLQLLRQAVKVQDAISVEEQLERVGANVNRIKGRMKYLETMTGLCTVNVSLYGEEKAAAADGFISWSLVGRGFWQAARVLVNVFFVLLQVLLVAIPLAALGGGAAWGVVRVVRRVRRARRSRTPAGSPSAPGR